MDYLTSAWVWRVFFCHMMKLKLKHHFKRRLPISMQKIFANFLWSNTKVFSDKKFNSVSTFFSLNSENIIFSFFLHEILQNEIICLGWTLKKKNNVCNNREQFDVFNAIMMLCTLGCKKMCNSLNEIMSDWNNVVFCWKIIKVQSDFISS
jgi:hypothetical protein